MTFAGDLPVDFAVTPAFGHENGVQRAVEAVHTHPDGHGEGFRFTGDAEAHAVADVAKLQRPLLFKGDDFSKTDIARAG